MFRKIFVYGVPVIVITLMAFSIWQWRLSSDFSSRLNNAEQLNAKLLYTNGIACSLLSYGEAKNLLSTSDALKVQSTRVPAGVVSTNSNDFKPAIDTCAYVTEHSDGQYISFALQQYLNSDDASSQFEREKQKAIGSTDYNAAKLNADQAFAISNSVMARRDNFIVSAAIARKDSSKDEDSDFSANLVGKIISVVAESSLRF